MGEPTNTAGENGQLIGKFLAWLGYIALGIMAKLAIDSRTAKLGWRQIVIKVMLSLFAGALACFTCEAFHYMRMAPIVVPVATLLGEAIALYIITNWSYWVEKYFPWLKRKK